MRTPVFVSFGTREYEVIADHVSGTAYILRHRDNATTYRLTCSEGMEEYRLLKRAWRASQWAFHRRCRTHTYYPD